MSPDLIFRPAIMEDAEVLLAWRNDPLTRAASHQTDPISEEAHRDWLAKTIADPHRRLRVVEEEGKAIGTVRADFKDGAWELSWTLAPEARGRGCAKRMVALFAAQFSEPLRAEVKAGHAASVRIAEYAGLELVEEKNGVLHFRRGAL